MKRTVFAFLTGAFLMFAASAYAVTTSFSDVSTNDWFYNDVMNMVEWGVIQGYPDGTFGPANNVNRAELSAMWNRYDNRVKGLIGNTSSGGDNQAIADLYLLLAYDQINFAINNYRDNFNKKMFNSLGGVGFTKDCGVFDITKASATSMLNDAKIYGTVNSNDESFILNMIDTYEDMCYDL